MLEYLVIASGLISTTYGHGEARCGDYGQPRACEQGAVTASGQTFQPEVPSAAIALPRNRILRARIVHLRVGDGPCKPINLNDKLNERYIGKRGFDLSPAAVQLLTGKPATRHWSGTVHVCEGESNDQSHNAT